MDHFFSPLKIKNIEMRNRIVMPPMCMYSASESGHATPWHSFHYRTRAQGGCGLIIQEATAVEARGRISSHDLGIWDDNHISGLSEIASVIKSEGAVAGIQLAHAGRKCTVPGEDIIAPSPINFDPEDASYVTPREMEEEDIDDVVDSFKTAAERAQEAGYQILEIHGAHGYLISEFLSPLTNLRNDIYGGGMEGRIALLLKITKAVRSVWKARNPLMLRVSALDYGEGGNQAEDLAEAVNLVKQEGVDIVHVSTGGVIPHARIPLGPAYQIPAAKIIRDLSGLPVVGGGLITDPDQVEEVLSTGSSDMVFLGRELLRNPYFPLQTAQERGIDLDYWPKQYTRAK